jgi:RHS repeat-associated protein
MWFRCSTAYHPNGLVDVSYVYGNNLIAQVRGNNANHYLLDALNSTRIITDASGNILNSYDYEAFGEAINQNESVTNQYRYTGEQFDSNLQDYYLRARYYDTDSGRFIRRDTFEGNLTSPISLNKYIYGNDNPVLYRDPSGLFSLGELTAAENISDELDRQQQRNYFSVLQKIQVKTHDVYSAIQPTLIGLSPIPVPLIHAFVYSTSNMFPPGKVERGDVGPHNPVTALLNPLSTVAGGVYFSFDQRSNVEVFYVARVKAASLPVFKYLIWKGAVSRLPAGDGYGLITGPNCITWTITASLFARALEK